MPVDEHDWLFDYILQFLESDKFDAAVMDFVDEKCEFFDNDDENKFIYTTIHEEFREHLEVLITSNLGELNVTGDMFLDAMEKGRNDRDINKLVFERLTAIDDFLTFKRMMVKRNMELQVEALRSYQSSKLSYKFDLPTHYHDDNHDHDHDDNDDNESEDNDSNNDGRNIIPDDPLPQPEELRAQKEKELEELAAQEAMLDDEELQEILQSSLMEMELLHRREELEQADLEAALALSLSLEEERIRLLRLEAKNSNRDNDHDEDHDDVNAEFTIQGNSMAALRADADAKESRNMNLDSPSKRGGSSKDLLIGNNNNNNNNSNNNNSIIINNSDAKSPMSSINTITSSNRGQIHMKPIVSPKSGNVNNLPDPKPLRTKELKPLPAISKMSAELEDRKRQAEELLRSNAEQMISKRQLEEDLRQQMKQVAANGNGKMTDEQLEMEKRAKHMREQRDKILAAKKAEREKKVREEEERNQSKTGGGKNVMPSHVAEAFAQAHGHGHGNHQDAKGGSSYSNSSNSNSNTTMVVVTDETEARRGIMRMALARRLKMDLIESEEQKLAKQQEEQFADLDRQLQHVEQLRQENRQRELVLTEQLKRQQYAIARNVKMSSAKLKEEA